MTSVRTAAETVETSLVNKGSSFAFVVELENAQLSGLERAGQMLKVLQEQAIAHRPQPSRPPQIVILYDKHETDSRMVEQIVAESLDLNAWDVAINIVGTDKLKYYELKNYGVSLTDRDIVLFIDSDTIPEPGWLTGLLSAIDEPNRSVVCGNTYVASETFLGRASNLFWIFETRSESDDLREIDYLYANNVAFKRSVLERYPFPDLESFRGQCHVLSEQLRRDGVTIYRHDGSRLAHPPPGGIAHFLKRAIWQGHDEVTIGRIRAAGTRQVSLAGSFDRFKDRVRMMLDRTARHRRDIGLSWPGAVGAVAIGGVYCVFQLFGEVVTYASPKFVRRYLPI
jgi:hypothetical protein